MEICYQDERGQQGSVSPARDLAIIWPYLITLAAQDLQPHTIEDWLRDLAVSNHISCQQLQRCLQAYYNACSILLEVKYQTPYDCLQESGFFAFPAAAQVVVMAKLGQLATGVFFHGVKTTTKLGTTPASIQQLIDFTKQQHTFTNKSLLAKIVSWFSNLVTGFVPNYF